MRGGASLGRFALPLIRPPELVEGRATFSPSLRQAQEGRRKGTYFAAQSFSRVVDIAAAAEKP
jgi:hypothetical protein